MNTSYIYNKVGRRYWYVIAFCLFVLTASPATAQEIVFGHFSYQQVLTQMADYQKVQQEQAALKAQYDGEAQRMAEEFNNKYEEFLEVQRTLAPAILNKRQAELQALANRAETFKQEARQQMAQAEKEAMAPVQERLNAAITTIGQEKGFAFIANSDNNALPYVDSTKGEDITQQLIDRLNP